VAFSVFAPTMRSLTSQPVLSSMNGLFVALVMLTSRRVIVATTPAAITTRFRVVVPVIVYEPLRVIVTTLLAKV